MLYAKFCYFLYLTLLGRAKHWIISFVSYILFYETFSTISFVSYILFYDWNILNNFFCFIYIVLWCRKAKLRHSQQFLLFHIYCEAETFPTFCLFYDEKRYLLFYRLPIKGLESPREMRKTSSDQTSSVQTTTSFLQTSLSTLLLLPYIIFIVKPLNT